MCMVDLMQVVHHVDILQQQFRIIMEELFIKDAFNGSISQASQNNIQHLINIFLSCNNEIATGQELFIRMK